MRGLPFSWSKVDFAVQSTTNWAFASVTRAASRRHVGIVLFIYLRSASPPQRLAYVRGPTRLARRGLAAEGPLHQGVHDEDGRDEREEDAVDVDV